MPVMTWWSRFGEQEAQHAGGVGCIDGFAEDLLIADRRWCLRRGRWLQDFLRRWFRLFRGRGADGKLSGDSPGRRVSSMSAGWTVKANTGLGEEFAAARRGAGEDQHAGLGGFEFSPFRFDVGEANAVDDGNGWRALRGPRGRGP